MASLLNEQGVSSIAKHNGDDSSIWGSRKCGAARELEAWVRMEESAEQYSGNQRS